MSRTIDVDDHGFPIMLATRDYPTTRSGNPTHNVRTGQFGPRGRKRKGVPAPISAKATVDQSELARRMDAVREAAREFEQFSEQDIKEWLNGRTNRALSEDEVAAFLRDVRSQQISDLVDILDQSERGSRRGRRFVRVNAPRGFTRKSLNGLKDDELRELVRRLRARGWDDKQLAGFSKKLPEKRRTVVEGLSAEPGPLVRW